MKPRAAADPACRPNCGGPAGIAGAWPDTHKGAQPKPAWWRRQKVRIQVFRHWLCRLGRNQKGATALEYAVVAPLLFGVIFVSIEVTIILFADASLENASRQVTRIGKLGVPEGMNCETAVRQEMERHLSRWVASPADLRIDVKVYEPGMPFDNVDDESYVPVCDAGDRGDMVVYRLGFDRPGITGFISWLGIDIIRFERIVMIQNEP